MRPQKVAVVGTGIAGNVAAYRLHRAGHDLTVYEADNRIGGHTHTHSLELDGEVQRVDTGFIVFNDRTYPNFVALLEELGVVSQPSTMSFSVRNDATGLEYNGTSLNGLFAQRRNLLRPGFIGMLAEILRFHREAPALLRDDAGETTLGAFLEAHRFGGRFVEDYLIPMGAAIWSTDPALMFDFPARFFVRFLYNHGLLTVNDRPLWRVIRGGSARYVERLVAPFRKRIRLNSPVERIRRRPDGVMLQVRGREPVRYDHVFLACHADQALRLLADPTPEEREILGALPYQRNEALLHTDTTLLPSLRRARAAWNYHWLPGHRARVALTYDMNVLQSLRSRHTFCVTLNASERVDPRLVLRRIEYAHPLFTPAGVAAQRRHAEISGVRGTHYCGAYWRYGFHEDGVVSALQALARFEDACRSEVDDAQRALSRLA
ncbi:MAG TPA: FAD-dependent oxidoreductase [Steroidobacteraceae bacterium]|nr:FAD-dependent oxidoreductase [Steroidobacteraceae bacterium]